MINQEIGSRVKIQDIIGNQLPSFILDESPKTLDFINQYYISQEYQSGPADITDNLDQYLKFDNLVPEVTIGHTDLQQDVSKNYVDSDGNIVTDSNGVELPTPTIFVSSTKGFPEKYGLLKINDEVITYKSKTETSFVDCVRGFSGITNYHKDLDQEELVFLSSSQSEHKAVVNNVRTKVENLSSLFLKEFYSKLKYTFAPGFEDKTIHEDINARNFLKEIKSFYESKGTEKSISTLTKVLFGKESKVLNLEDYLLKPSSADFSRRKIVVVEKISGDITKIIGQTIKKSTDSNVSAVVSELESFTRKGKIYHRLSLYVGNDDYSSIQGEFSITPNTKSIEKVTPNLHDSEGNDIGKVITVDSTIGFAKEGTIYSGNNTISYTDKSINQFLGCTGISETVSSGDNVRSDEIYVSYENGDINKKVEFRITGVLSDVRTLDKLNVNAYKDQKLKVQTIGELVSNPSQDKTHKEVFSNSWIYNSSSSADIESIEGASITLKGLIDNTKFKIGDRVEIVSKSSGLLEYPKETDEIAFIKNISIDNTGNFQKSTIDVNFNSFSEYNSNLEYSLRRVLNKSHSDIESISFKYGNDSIISDVQNVYFDSDFAYVASNSLPSSEITEENQYRDENRDNKSFLYLLNLTKNLIRSEITNSTQFSDQITDDTALSGEGNEEYTSIIFESKVNFISGDIISYNTDSTPIKGLSVGNYFAKVIRDSNPDIDGKKVKLFLSLVDLSYDRNPVRFSATQGSIIGSHSFTLTNQSSSHISPKKVFKKFPLEFDSSYTTLDSTDIGSIGLLINGVEIENYKSNDNIYYGPLESVSVINKGSGYDIIKPPKITVSESTGDDALVTPTITGTIEEILVDPQNFDVGTINSIKITGGNFSGGKFEPVIGRSKKSLSFSGTSEVGVFANSLVLDENHGLSNGDEVTYLNDGNPSIPLSGNESLLNGTSYFVSVDNTKTIRLYGTYENAISRTNNLVFDTSSNVGGLHRITIGELKNNLTEILVIDGGTVSSKKLIVKPENVSTLFDTINFKGHGFSTGELVSYEYETTSISGLNVDNQYYVVTIDEDSFKLCDAGINGLDTTNFNDRTFVSFTSSGSGYQTFKYPDIKVSVDYSINGAPIAISTTGNIVSGSSTITNIDTTGIEEGQNVVNSSLNLDTSVISVGQNQVTIGSTVGSAATDSAFEFTSVINLTPVAKGKIDSIQLYNKGTDYGSLILNFQLKPDVKVEKGNGGQIKVVIINGRVDIASVQFPGYNYFSTPTLNVYDPTGAGSGAKLRAVVSESGSITDVKILSKGIGYSNATIVEIIDSGSGATFDVELRSLAVNKVEKVESDKQYECLTNLNNNLQYSISGYFKNLRESFNEKLTRNSGIIGWAFDGNPIYGPYGISDAEDLDSTTKLLTSGYTANLNNIENRPSTLEFPLGFFIDDYAYTGQGDLDEHNGRFEKTKEYPNGTYVYHATIASENPVFPYFIGNTYKSKYINENKNLTQYFDFNNSELKRNVYPYGLSQDNFSNDFILESNKIEDQKISVESVTEGYIDDIEIISSGDGYKVGQFLDFDNTGTEGGNSIAKVESVKGKEITQVTTSVESFTDSVLTWSDEKIKITTTNSNLLEDKKYITISGITTSSSNIYKLNNTTNQISIIKNGSTPLIASVSASDTEIYVSHIPDNVSVGNSITIESETLEILNISKSKNILRVNRGSSTSYGIGSTVNFKNYSFTIDAKLNYFDSKVNKKVYFNSTESVGVGTISGIGFNTSFTYGNETIERSIPAQRIYIENHPFKTNDKVTFYDPNNSGIDKLKYTPVSGDSAGVDLPQTLYVVNTSKNTIGIKTGIGTDSNGDEFSEVFFTQSGSSNNTYSFTTNYDQEVADVKKITTTVSLSTAANISTGDIITLNVQPNLNVGIGTSTVVKLDNISIGNNKVLSTDEIVIDVNNVDVNENIITLSSHPFKTGDKVYYGAGNSSIGGLVTNQSYFISKIDNNRFKLCQTYEGSLKNPPNEIDLGSTSGTIVALYNVHPQIRVTKGNNIVFDTTLLSSLEEPKIFRDQKFNHEFVSTGSTSGFNIIKGTNSLTINYDSNIPERLYYNLETSGYISTSDTEVKKYNEILFEDSYYSDTFEISSVGTDFTSFTFEMTEEPERNSYLKADCTTLEYATTSTAESGPVNSLELVSGGSGYKKIPTISGIDTTGNDFSGLIKSKTIGKINQVEIVNPGFDYSSDKTLSPSAFISPKITLINSNTLNTIEVVDGGNSITFAPDLEIVDKKTKIAINSGLLQPIVSGSSIGEVEVLSQPFGLPEDIEVYAVNNSQGLSVNKVISNNTGIFTCVITTPVNGFSVSPLNVGDKVFVEGIQIVNSTSSQLGYNSKNHGYQLFDVQTYSDAQITPGISQDEVVLSIPNVSGNTGIALTVQPSSASLIKESDYPTFKATTKPSFFQKGEKLLISGRDSDLVVVSQSNLEDLEIFGTSTILSNDILSGESSAVISTVKQVEKYNLNFETDFGSDKNIGWQTDIGKLGLSNQVLPDNDYYQNLSYSVRSTIEWDDLKTPLNNLAHTSGTKNFADTEIVSETDQDSLSVSIQSPIDITLDIVDQHRVDTIFNFDLARDVDIFSEGNFVSSRMIEFKTFDFVKYIAMETNRVLIIDDIKEQFSTDEFDPALHLDLIELTELEGYSNYTFKISGIDGDNKVQLTDVVVIGNGDNIAIAEKQSISNSGGVFHEDGEVYADVSLYKNEFGKTFLRFTPTDPYDTELDIKYLDRSFIPNIVGVGTISGFEAVQSKVSTVLINQEPTILSFDKNNFESLHVTAIATKESSKETNFIEAYVIHDGTDVTVLDYYFDTSEISLSLNPVGIFTGSINGSDLQLKFINTSDEDVVLKARVVGFDDQLSPDPTQYRFNLPQQDLGYERSLIYRNQRTTGTGTTIEVLDTGTPSLENNLYTSNFDSIKSLVQIEQDGEKTLHQVLLLQSDNEIYVQQGPFLTTENENISGIGTFGGKYDGSEFKLLFHPSNINDTVLIHSISEVFYTDVDIVNDAPDLEFGPSIEKVKTFQYFAINGNRINKKDFLLNHQGTPIFAKRFDPSEVLDKNTGIFTIKNHFFSDNEEVEYSFGTTFLGVTATALTTASQPLASPITINLIDENSFKLRSNGTLVNGYDTGSGVGNDHQLSMVNNLNKSLITINNIAQTPLVPIQSNIGYTISNDSNNVNDSQTLIPLNRFDEINIGNVLKVGDEYMVVSNVGMSTNINGPISGSGAIVLAEVNRGSLGSVPTSHTDGSTVTLNSGSYNIVGQKIHFTEAPRGNNSITRDGNYLVPDRAEFGGRVFLKKDYDTNDLYDDVSPNFDGIENEFTLTVGGANTTGIGTEGGSGLVFINGIYQSPTTENNPSNNFRITENETVGITTIAFTGITTVSGTPIIIDPNDINQNQIPRGGIIVSLGSTGGIGYAPLVGASVTGITTNGSGTITDLQFSDYGSGYYPIGGTVDFTIESTSGSSASISGTIGAGGSIFVQSISGGSGYHEDTTQIIIPEPSYSSLSIAGLSRLGQPSTDTGIGLSITVDVGEVYAAGIGSTVFGVSSFNITKNGYSFKKGDKFTPVGLVTAYGLDEPIEPFVLSVEEVFTDNFSAWNVGQFTYVDSIKIYQDGIRTRFPLYQDGELISFEIKDDSLVDIQNVLFIIINGIIQEPVKNYVYDGGSAFAFTEPPKPEDNVTIFVYRGTIGSDDSGLVNVVPQIENGDRVQINEYGGVDGQEPRIVSEIISSDVIETEQYYGSGINETYRPVSLIKQKADLTVRGEVRYKTRQSILSQIYPTARIIKDIDGTTSPLTINVDNSDLFTYDIGTDEKFETLIVDDNASREYAEFDVTVTNGSITGISVSDGGSGYTPDSTVDLEIPNPSFESPNWPTISSSNSVAAAATATVDSTGTITSVSTPSPAGVGYTSSINVFAPLPDIVTEKTSTVQLVSQNANVVGVAGTIVKMFISGVTPNNVLSFVLKRNDAANWNDNPLAASDHILIRGTLVGNGITSMDTNFNGNPGSGQTIGIGTTCLDNIYQLTGVIDNNGVIGGSGSYGGWSYVRSSDSEIIVNTNIDGSGKDLSSINGGGPGITEGFVGEFSFGKITLDRTSPIAIGVSGRTVDAELSEYPIIQRRTSGLRETGSLEEKI